MARAAAAAPGGFARALSWLSDGDPEDAHARLAGFRRFVLLFGAVRSWLWLALGGQAVDVWVGITALALSGCAALCWAGRRAPLATRLAFGVLLVQLVWTFPQTDNHFFLELYLVALLSLVDGPEDAPLVLPSLRWLVVLVLLHAGLQKVWYGHYFQGDFLAFMIGQSDRFADAFSVVVPAAEVERLRALDPLRTGAGPFRVPGLLLPLLSNLVWLAEVALPVAMLWPRWRSLATGGAIALVLAIQLGALEFGFATLYTAALCMLPAPDWSRRALPVLAGLLLYALLAVWLGLPGGGWLQAGNL